MATKKPVTKKRVKRPIAVKPVVKAKAPVEVKTASGRKIVKKKSALDRMTPFGMVNDTASALQFNGTGQELARALEQSFMPKPIVHVPPPVVATRPKKKKKFDRNRDGATEGEIERARKHITNVIEVPDNIRQKYAERLRTLTQDFTEFLLLEIAPYESALESAMVDAADSIQIITGVQDVEFSLGRAKAVLQRITELKTLEWACRSMDMPADIRELLLKDYMGSSNENGSGSSQLSKLSRPAVVSGQEEGVSTRMLQSQIRALGRSIMEANKSKQKRSFK